MRRIFHLIFQLIVLAVVMILFTAAWIVFDGQIDDGAKADVALVTGSRNADPGASQSKLDRVVSLYNGGEFRYIIVSGSRASGSADDPASMTQYLEGQGIPSSAIIENNRGDTTVDTARSVAEIMKERRFQSVMLVTDYYRMTRTHLVLMHDGVQQIEKAHVGKFQKEDVLAITREVIALYDYIGRTYLLPAAEKAKEEAQVGLDKASVEAGQAKQRLDKSIDGLKK